MFTKNLIGISIFITLVSIVGCTKTPKCSDDETINTLKELISENIKGLSPQQITIDGILTQSHEDSIDKYLCTATATYNFSPTQGEAALEIKNADILKSKMNLAQAELVAGQFFGQAVGVSTAPIVEKERAKIAVDEALKEFLDKINFDGKTIKQGIGYSVQIDDKKEKFYVSAQGYEEVSSIFLAIDRNNENKKKFAEKNQQESDVPQSTSNGNCVSIEMAKWEKQREKEVREWCDDLAKKGEECRISAGQDELVKQEALNNITAQCK